MLNKIIGMSKDLNADIVYFALVIIEDVSYYMCMNKHCLYCFVEPIGGVDQDHLYEVKYEIEYIRISKIIRFKNKSDIVQIVHSDKRNENPNPLIVKTEDIETLVKYLTCYWETAVM